MIPLEDNLLNSIINGTWEGQNYQFFGHRGAGSYENPWINHRLLAYQEFAHYLKYFKELTQNAASEDETKKLMALAYQGSDLKYSINTNYNSKTD